MELFANSSQKSNTHQLLQSSQNSYSLRNWRQMFILYIDNLHQFSEILIDHNVPVDGEIELTDETVIQINNTSNASPIKSNRYSEMPDDQKAYDIQDMNTSLGSLIKNDEMHPDEIDGIDSNISQFSYMQDDYWEAHQQNDDHLLLQSQSKSIKKFQNFFGNESVANEFELPKSKIKIERVKNDLKPLPPLRKRILSQQQSSTTKDAKSILSNDAQNTTATSPVRQKLELSPEHIKAHELIKKMNYQRRHMSELKQRNDERKLQEIQEMENVSILIQKERDQQQRQSKRQQIAERINEEHSIRQEIAKANLEGNNVIKQIKKKREEEEMRLKMKDDELMRPELEKRKTELAKKREMSQPIRLEQIKEHQKKYEEERKKIMLQRESVKIERELELKNQAFKIPKSNVQLKLEEQEKAKRIEEQKAAELKKQLKEKESIYTKVVREAFIPRKRVASTNVAPTELSPPKKEIKKLDYLKGHPHLARLEKKTATNINKTVRQYIKYFGKENDEIDSLFYGQKDNSVTKSEHIQSPFQIKKSSKQTSPIRQAGSTTQIQMDSNPPKKVDYLKAIRRQRSERGEIAPQKENWEKYVNDESLPKIEKYNNVMVSIKKMEEKARQKEQIKRPDADDEANKLYIDSIKAKLALLQQK